MLETVSTDRLDTPAPRGLGLHVKLTLAAALTIFTSVAAVAGLLAYQQTKVMRAEIQRDSQLLRDGMVDRGQLLAENLAANMENAIAGFNFAFVAESMETVQDKNPDLAYAFVTNSANVIIVHTDPSFVGSTVSGMASVGEPRMVRGKKGRKLLEITHPLTVGGEYWGTLQLTFDLASIDKQAAEALVAGSNIIKRSMIAAILVALIFSALGLTASGLLSRKLLQPINRLARDAELIAEGNLHQEIQAIESRDEFGVLARQFELMRRSIKSYISELVVARQRAEAATREEQRLRAEIEKHSQLLESKVRERTSELQATNERLKEYDRLKSEFLSNVSHELRSPIAAISSAAKIISRYGDENPKSDKRFSSVIIEESRRLSRLINDLLDLAKIEAGRVEWDMAPIEDPAEVLDHVARTFKPLFTEREINLELTAAPDLPEIQGDRDRLIQVFTNLCSNAMKYTPPNGTVRLATEISTHQDKPVLKMTVQDSGPGIPADQLEHVFERFHQVKQSKKDNKPTGTGLGLAICREVVAHHGGWIWAEAPDCGGTRMVVALPTDLSASNQATTAPEATPNAG